MYVNSNPIKPISDQYTRKEVKRHRDNFHHSIVRFLEYCNSNGEIMLKITNICERFGFQRRRFYDLATILQAFGILQKENLDMVKWVGMGQIIPTLEKVIHERGIGTADSSNISTIFPSVQKLLMSSIAVDFTLLFITQRRQKLNIQETASFFARDNGRFKSTLCKLYQIVYILIELGIVERRNTPNEVYLADRYFNYFCNQPVKQPFPIPITVQKVASFPIPYLSRSNDPFDSIFCIESSYGIDIDPDFILSE